MQFKQIIGQEEVKHRLRLSVREGRIPHAQLFYGPAGVGKLQLAIAYAQYLACENRTDTDSCGVCQSCKRYQQLQHPDLHFAFPIYKEKPGRDSVCNDYIDKFRELVVRKPYFSQAEWYEHIGLTTKQGVIYEAESSEIIRKLSLKSFYNGYKVMIIWLPEKMNTVCANKLLKILEEPAPQTLFLLVSEEPESLLTTILSRVQQIKIPLLNEKDIASALRKQYEDMTVEESLSIAHIANGSYVRALQQLQEKSDQALYLENFIQLMRLAYRVGRKEYAALKELQKWSQDVAAWGREMQKNFLAYAQQQVRENFIRNFSQPEINYQTIPEENFSVKFSRFINEKNVEQFNKELDLAQQQIEQNGNARIIFFDLCLQFIVLLNKGQNG